MAVKGDINLRQGKDGRWQALEFDGTRWLIVASNIRDLSLMLDLLKSYMLHRAEYRDGA